MSRPPEKAHWLSSSFPEVVYPTPNTLTPHVSISKACREQCRDTPLARKGHTPWADGLDYVLQGHGIYRDQHREVAYGPHSVILTRKGFWYSYVPAGSEPLTHIWVRFEGPAPEALLAPLDVTKTVPLLDVAPDTSLAAQFVLMHKLCGTGTRADGEEAAAITLALLAATLRRIHLREHGGGDKPDAVTHFMVHAQENAGIASIDIKAFARQHGVGYEAFRKSFRRRLGMAPHAYWLQCKLNLARALLEKSDRPISDIADIVGYPTVYAFSAYFKRRTDQSPTEYRQLHQQ